VNDNLGAPQWQQPITTLTHKNNHTRKVNPVQPAVPPEPIDISSRNLKNKSNTTPSLATQPGTLQTYLVQGSGQRQPSTLSAAQRGAAATNCTLVGAPSAALLQSVCHSSHFRHDWTPSNYAWSDGCARNGLNPAVQATEERLH
jgi:hypothetical protein